MGKHSNIVGGSTASRVLKCPGSIDLCKNLPGQEWNEKAAKGTALHWVMEECITTGKVPEHYTGVYHAQVELTEDMIRDKGRVAFDFFQKFRKDLGGFDRLYVEKEVGFQELDKDDVWYIEGAFGTGDIIFDNGVDRCGVIDWKFGDGWIVSAADNDQMRFYLAGAIAYGYLPEVDVYEAHIFQPAAGRDEDTFHSMAEYTFEELDAFACELSEAVNGVRNFNPGKHCHFCKAKTNCTAFTASMMEAVYSDLTNVTPEDFAKYMGMIPAVIAWTKEIRAAAIRNAMKGVVIPGYRLDTPQGNRYYPDEKEAEKGLKDLGLKPKDIMTEKKVMSPAQIEPVLKRYVKEGKITQTDMLEFYNDYVDRPDLPETLIECEPGEENSVNMAEGFKELWGG